MFRRSPREIIYRLRQESVNLARFLRPPLLPLKNSLKTEAVFADPSSAADAVRGSRFAEQAVAIAEQAIAHRFRVFGVEIDTGSHIDWHRDYRNGKTSSNDYFRRIPYLDMESVGDHKWIWELNRHQHLIVLAQAHLLTGRYEFISEIEGELTSWLAQNPFVRGINWASALEVAFRALSWIWIDLLAGDRLRTEVRIALQNGLWLHARHLEANLSVYFSPNTHLLGEAVALHAIGRLYPAMPDASRFESTGSRVSLQQLEFQVKPDGSHFEQSTYYHVYALDLFLLHYLLAGRPSSMRPRLGRMAGYLNGIAGPSRRLFASGDDDGGRLFFPYGPRDRFPRATLATCAALFPDLGIGFEAEDLNEQAVWWLAPPLPSPVKVSAPSASFPDSGMVTITQGDLQVLFDAGPFGWGRAGHSHSDTLNILVRYGDRTLLRGFGDFHVCSRCPGAGLVPRHSRSQHHSYRRQRSGRSGKALPLGEQAHRYP